MTPRPPRFTRRAFLTAFAAICASVAVPSIPAAQKLLATAPRWKREIHYRHNYLAWLVAYHLTRDKRRWVYARLITDINSDTLAWLDTEALKAFTRSGVKRA